MHNLEIMRVAFTIGAYRLCDFIKLNILQLRRLVPGAKILISDDVSPESRYIQDICKEFEVPYLGSDVKRGHFAGDVQAIINALSFGRATNADVAIKISQRFIFRKPECLGAVLSSFLDETVDMVCPGVPNVTHGAKQSGGFGKFAVLSDVVAFRPSAVDPNMVLDAYRKRVETEIVPWKDFVEALVHSLHTGPLNGRSRIVEAITNTSLEDPGYLRRYQCDARRYLELAKEVGLSGRGLFPTCEWHGIDGRMYSPRPKVI